MNLIKGNHDVPPSLSIGRTNDLYIYLDVSLCQGKYLMTQPHYVAGSSPYPFHQMYPPFFNSVTSVPEQSKGVGVKDGFNPHSSVGLSSSNLSHQRAFKWQRPWTPTPAVRDLRLVQRTRVSRVEQITSKQPMLTPFSKFPKLYQNLIKTMTKSGFIL